ncbi:MAG: ABC transporter permease [Isosphaeraceae bacterium]
MTMTLVGDLEGKEPAPAIQLPALSLHDQASREAALALTVITPPTRHTFVNLQELWRFRDLLYFLAWRDVKVRYKQTALGVAWAVLQPAMMMAVFTLFFRRMAGVPSGGVPYPLFAYVGLLPWTFFSTAVAGAAQSVIGSERIITKIYFPRLAIPFSAVGATVVDFFVALGLLAGMMAWYGVAPGPNVWLAPVVFSLIVLAALGVGTLLSALNVSYRDFRYVIPFLLQVWMFATPAVYMQVNPVGEEPRPAASVATIDHPVRPAPAPEGGRALDVALALNPLTGLIATFRASLLGGPVPWGSLAGSAVSVVGLFVVGCLYFRKVEDRFSDII